MWDKFVYLVGEIFIILIVALIMLMLASYIEQLLKKQKKIKCLCHHEYEPNAAYYSIYGIEYEFKCRKCGKIISVKTVSRDEFKWVENKDEV